MDARHIKVSCKLPGLELAGCTDLCSVLQAMWVYVQENSGGGAALTVDLSTIDRNAPLGSTVRTAATCLPISEYRWTIQNLATGTVYTFAGAPGVDASGETAVAGGTYDLPLIDWNGEPFGPGGQLCNYRVTLTVTDACNRYTTDVELSLLPSGTTGVLWARQRFGYTGSDQIIQVPACATQMLAKCWGAGGNAQSYLATHAAGAGGYTEALIPVTPGETLHVVVGEGGKGVSAYGFAGVQAGGSGGGLSGIFRKSTAVPVLTSEASLALIIAGGGGGADYAGTAQSRGGNGNDPVYSGGQPTMQGASDNIEPFPARTWNAGGGGGYNGGGHHQRDSIQGSAPTLPWGGEGGSGFVTAGATNIIMLATPDGHPGAPNSSDSDYEPSVAVGGPGLQTNGYGGDGLVVIYWMT